MLACGRDENSTVIHGSVLIIVQLNALITSSVSRIHYNPLSVQTKQSKKNSISSTPRWWSEGALKSASVNRGYGDRIIIPNIFQGRLRRRNVASLSVVYVFGREGKGGVLVKGIWKATSGEAVLETEAIRSPVPWLPGRLCFLVLLLRRMLKCLWEASHLFSAVAAQLRVRARAPEREREAARRRRWWRRSGRGSAAKEREKQSESEEGACF